MKTNLFLFLLLSVLLSSCLSSSKQMNLIENGQSAYTIIIPIDADSLINKAATEFQSFIQQSTEVKLPIERGENTTTEHAIFIGFDDYQKSDKMPEESIYAYVAANNLWIGGGDTRSTLYACYDFLETHLGIRFFSPDYTQIPRQQSLAVQANLDYFFTPPVTTRTVHANLFYDNHDFADRLKVTHEAFPKYVPDARVHTFHRFLPADEYFEQHPEYYALRNGKRLTTQLCLTHPEVLAIVKEKVEDLFEAHPDHPIVSVSQDDNTLHCQCENCQAIDQREGSPAGTMIHFVNEVAKAFPEKTISTLAYQYTRKAPRYVKPAKNVLITLCSIECDRSAPIAENCPDFAQDLIEWGQLTDNIRIWDYTTQFTNFLAPFPNIRTLGPNIDLFVDNNAQWIFEQHSNAPSELFELRAYLTAKLLWNPELDPYDIMDEFFTGYYEKAAPFVKNYVHKVHDELEEDSSFFLFLYGDPSQGFNSFLNADNLNLYNAWYDSAEVAVKDDPVLLKRVQKARLSVDYASLEAARKGLSNTFSLQTNPAATEKRLNRFEQVTQREGITAMNEMRYTVKEYIEAYLETLNRSEVNNIAYKKMVTLMLPPKKYADEDPQTLTDGAYGGTSFYANWLGFEGNDMEAIIDLGMVQDIGSLSTAFLQVVNHIVFFPVSVSFHGSVDGENYTKLGDLRNQQPLNPESKINDIQYFSLENINARARYIKIKADNREVAPDWHHGSGLPAWIFVDEVIIERK